MSRGLTIVEPMPIAVAAANHGTGVEFIRTPDPKEVYLAPPASGVALGIDLGAIRQIDTVFIGFTNASPGATWDVQASSSLAGSALVSLTGETALRLPGGAGPRYHGVARLGAPVETRYLRIVVSPDAGAPQLEIGAVVIGKRFEHSYEYKSGRRPIDLSERVDLVGGGFGFGRGAIKSSFRFTFADLAKAEADRLWRIVTNVGNQHPLVLVEGGDGAIEHDQVHYGVFERFEAYERKDPIDTRWALSMQDWI